MEKQTVVILIAALYLLSSFLIGAYYARRQKTLENYFAAGRTLGPFVTGMAMAASHVSGWTFIGVPGVAYAFGIVLIAERVIYFGQSLLPWLFLARKLRILASTHGCLTIPDALYARYQNKLVSALGALSVFFGLLGYTATQLLALGTLMAVIFKISFLWGLVVSVVILAGYTVLGGIEGAIRADVLQGVIMIGASLFIFFGAYAMIGGPGEAYRSMKALNPELVQFTGKWSWPFLLTIALANAGSFAAPHIATKFYMTENIQGMKTSGMLHQFFIQLMGGIGLSVPFAYLTLEYRGVAQHLTNPDDVTPVFVMNYMPSLVAGLVLAGALAAIMSTVSGFLNQGAAVLVRDLLQTTLGLNLKNEVRAARIGTVVFLAAALTLAFTAKTLVLLLGAASVAVFGATLIPSLVIGLWWKRATAQGAIAAMVVGLIMSVGMQALSLYGIYKLPYEMLPGGIGVIVAIVVMLVVSFLTSTKNTVPADSDINKVISLPLIFRAKPTR